MQVRYDSEADAIFLLLRAAHGGEVGGQRLDDTRIAPSRPLGLRLRVRTPVREPSRLP